MPFHVYHCIGPGHRRPERLSRGSCCRHNLVALYRLYHDALAASLGCTLVHFEDERWVTATVLSSLGCTLQSCPPSSSYPRQILLGSGVMLPRRKKRQPVAITLAWHHEAACRLRHLPDDLPSGVEVRCHSLSHRRPEDSESAGVHPLSRAESRRTTVLRKDDLVISSKSKGGVLRASEPGFGLF